MFVLLLRWDEMRAYAKANQVQWPVHNSKATVLEEFARIYRANGLDVGACPGEPGDWGLNEHTTPPQLACMAENVMGNGTCRVV